MKLARLALKLSGCGMELRLARHQRLRLGLKLRHLRLCLRVLGLKLSQSLDLL